MPHCRVLVLGGYGFFGRRLVERLARHPDLHLLVAGRSPARAGALVRELDAAGTPASLGAVGLDGRAPGLASRLRTLAPHLVIDASGPFQGADYGVPLACIAAGVSYVDLADSRTFVGGIAGLDGAARQAGVFVTSGASTVPALSGAVVDHLARGLAQVHAIDIGISPGNRTERGLSTVRGILSYCGKPLPASAGGASFGWSGSWRHRYPAPVGPRLLSPVDVPDLSLLPPRYAGVPAVRFGAGLELEFLHRGMNLLAWLARAGLVSDWARHAAVLKAGADLFRRCGSDAGAMHVAVTGVRDDGAAITRTWQLVARDGHGPYVPTLAAAALVRMAAAHRLRPGAMPCIGLLALPQFQQEMDGLAITTGTD